MDVPVLSDRLAEMMESWPICGGVIAVVSGNGGVGMHPFGFADQAAATAVTRDHLFEIGSISKVFTGLLINGLVDDGLVDLDEPVIRYLPWVVMPDGSAGATVRQLLQHSAGIISGSDAVPDELAQAWLLRSTRSASAPGEFFHYSNIGFILLGLLVARMTGVPYPQAVVERFIGPAGMTSTRTSVTHGDRSSFSIGYAPWADDQPWLPGESLVPATWLETAAADGNIASTAGDMARFVRILLGRGRINGRAVVSEASIDRMITSLASDGEDVFALGRHLPVTSSRYGLGVNVEENVDGIQLTHGGGMVGYASFLIADLVHNVGVVVLTNANGDTPIAELLAREVHAELVGESSTVPFDLDPARWQRNERMLGTFRGRDREIEVVFVSDGLELHEGGESGRIFRTLQDRFACSHPRFRHHHLSFHDTASGGVWTHGPQSFVAGKQVGTEHHIEWEPFEGHYRSFSPWFGNFRVYQRDGQLYLDSAGGVEAPSAEQELIDLGDGFWRIGADSRLPERLAFGPIVNGAAVFIDKDGHRYSRTFTP